MAMSHVSGENFVNIEQMYLNHRCENTTCGVFIVQNLNGT